jgi:nitrogen fixation protein NifU and related proteins
MNQFQENILDHYKSPRHFGKPDWQPTHTAKLQNTTCGDEIEVFMMIEDNVIKEIGFIGEGCSISIASASILCEALFKKDMSALQKITQDNLISEMLQIDLTPTRTKCATLPLEAIHKAI